MWVLRVVVFAPSADLLAGMVVHCGAIGSSPLVDAFDSNWIIDEMNARLEPLRSFILPGGSALSAHLHTCRTVARRAERRVVALATMETINEHAVKYLNRLSDWFFVAGRISNDDGKSDVLWVPGANR